MKRSGGLRRTQLDRRTPLDQSGGLVRRSELRRGNGLERGESQLKRTELKRTKAPRRSPAKPMPAKDWEIEQILSEAWDEKVKSTPCVMCRMFPPSAAVRRAHAPELRKRQGHHIVTQRQLADNGFASRNWDSDNGMCLCKYHHDRHHHAVQKVPAQLVPNRAWRFAIALGLDWLIERHYDTRVHDFTTRGHGASRSVLPKRPQALENTHVRESPVRSATGERPAAGGVRRAPSGGR